MYQVAHELVKVAIKYVYTTALEKGKQTGKRSYSRNILTRLQLELGNSGNVVLNNFHFCTKEKMVGHGNPSSRFLI